MQAPTAGSLNAAPRQARRPKTDDAASDALSQEFYLSNSPMSCDSTRPARVGALSRSVTHEIRVRAMRAAPRGLPGVCP